MGFAGNFGSNGSFFLTSERSERRKLPYDEERFMKELEQIKKKNASLLGRKKSILNEYFLHITKLECMIQKVEQYASDPIELKKYLSTVGIEYSITELAEFLEDVRFQLKNCNFVELTEVKKESSELTNLSGLNYNL